MQTPEERAGYTIPEWCRLTGLGRTKAYQLMAAGEIEAVSVGRRRIIVTQPVDFLRRFVAERSA